MKITLTDNITNSLFDTLKPAFLKANEMRFEVAFAKYSGLSLIEDNLKKCLQNGGKAEFILGLDFRTTEPKVLRILYNLQQKGLDIKLFCFSDPSIDDTSMYHPKIYLIKKEDRYTISIGSSNLTYGGMKDNVEVNAVIQACIKEEIVSDTYAVYNRLKFQQSRFEPDLAYIDGYEEAYEIVRKKSVEVLKQKSTKKKILSLVRAEMKGKISPWRLAKDIIQAGRALIWP